jgi:hypothetical protein
MSTPNRDLLVLTKSKTIDPDAQEQEIELLNEVLLHVENMKEFCVANEIINLNNYKVVTAPQQIMRLIWKKETSKPFVFINNKN